MNDEYICPDSNVGVQSWDSASGLQVEASLSHTEERQQAVRAREIDLAHYIIEFKGRIFERDESHIVHILPATLS